VFAGGLFAALAAFLSCFYKRCHTAGASEGIWTEAWSSGTVYISFVEPLRLRADRHRHVWRAGLRAVTHLIDPESGPSAEPLARRRKQLSSCRAQAAMLSFAAAIEAFWSSAGGHEHNPVNFAVEGACWSAS